MSTFDEEEDPSFVQRHAGLIFIAIVVLVSPAIFFAARKIMHAPQSSSHKDEVMIRLPPPPPPPPRPRATPTPEEKPTPEQEQKMVEQHPQENEMKKPEPQKEKPPEALGTGIKGPGGSGAFNLGSGSGEGYYGPLGGGGSKYGFYGNQVKARIAEAVRNDPRTRKARMNLIVRIWPDSTGRITKVRISDQSGDAKLDDALQNQILTGLQLTEPPPSDMPLPIVMRLTAQRPQ